MEHRRFNSLAPKFHQEWVAKVLNMQTNPGKGPDVIDDKKVVEVKFTLAHSDRNYPLAWTTLEHQMDYNQGRIAYWGLGVYKLDREVENIYEENIDEFEKIVNFRELFIVKWDWMSRYKPSRCTGKTKKSCWDNTYRYPKYADLPQVIKTYEVEKGKVHLTRGVKNSSFNIDTLEAPF